MSPKFHFIFILDYFIHVSFAKVPLGFSPSLISEPNYHTCPSTALRRTQQVVLFYILDFRQLSESFSKQTLIILTAVASKHISSCHYVCPFNRRDDVRSRSSVSKPSSISPKEDYQKFAQPERKREESTLMLE